MRHVKEVNKKRSFFDAFMNISCPAITQSKLTCNTNISLITPGTPAQYTFKYCTKGTQQEDEQPYKKVMEAFQKSLSQNVRETNSQESSRRILAASFAHQKHNIIGATLAAYIIRNESRFHFSHKFVWCPLHDIYTIISGKSVNTNVIFNNSSAYFKNSAFDYLCRPRKLEELCPFEYYAQFKTVYKSSTKNENTYDFDNTYFKHPSYNEKTDSFRQTVELLEKHKLIKVHQYDFEDTANFNANILAPTNYSNEAMEEYARISVLLFFSYRTHQDLLIYGSYIKLFKKLIESKVITDKQIDFLQNIQDAKSNSFRFFNAGDLLERITNPKKQQDLNIQSTTTTNDNENIEECDFDIEMKDISLLQTDEFYDNMDYIEKLPTNISLHPIKHKGKHNCGYDMLSTINVGLKSSKKISKHNTLNTLNDTEYCNEVLQHEQNKITKKNLVKIIITHTNHIEASLPSNTKKTDASQFLQPNGTAKSILSWSNNAALDPNQKRAFEIICSSFLLSFYYEAELNSNGAIPLFDNEKEKLQILVGTRISKSKQLICFLHGPAGSGKSTVIEIVTTYVKQFCDYISPHLYNDRVIVITAMTGVAATMINGETTHSALYLNQKKRFQAEQIEQWENTKLVIIDEISFASKIDIEKIHANLSQLKQNTFRKYGGINIVFSGDMRQLEPVEKKPIYEDDVHQFKDWINCYISLNGLHRFKNDQDWGKLLLTFRNGTVTKKEIEKVNTRVVKNEISLPHNIKYATYDNSSRDAINTALFYKRCKDNKNNTAMQRTTMIVFANNFKIKQRVFKYPKLIWELCGEDDIKITQRQGRMDPMLKLYIGCPIMIPHNINVAEGIANGTQCILKRIVLKQHTNIQNVTIENEIIVQAVFASDVEYIILQHTNQKNRMPTTFKMIPKKYTFRVKAKLNTPLYNKTIDSDGNPARMTAMQLPILINNATTGHKLQGTSIESLFISQWNYSKNWPYVMLSRVKTIDGLYLRTPLSTDLDHYKIPEKLFQLVEDLKQFLPKKIPKNIYKQLEN